MAYKNEIIHNKANPINFINEGRNDHSYTYDSKDNAYKKNHYFLITVPHQ